DEQVAALGQRLAVELPAMERGRRSLVARLRVGQIQQLVLCELRRRQDLEQSALTGRPDLRNAADRLRIEHALANDPQPSRSLSDEHVSVWQEREAPGILEPAHDRHDPELRADGLDFAG